MFALIGYGLLGVVVAVGVVAVLVIVLPSDQLATPVRDVVPAGLPSKPEIRAADVARVRLPVTLRGYRMVDTDAVLDRLALELENRDRELEDLRRISGRTAPTRAPDTSAIHAPGSVGGPNLTGTSAPAVAPEPATSEPAVALEPAVAPEPVGDGATSI
jgi:DivIVA domain-containing protein